jgi:CheY-like chemotaxis protein
MAKNQAENYNWKGHCILIVEDTYLTYILLETALTPTQIKIMHADDGIKSLELVRDNPEIELVLMDIQIPLMDGIEATRHIKEMRPDLPVIAQTAHTMDDELHKVMDAGCDDYVTKPVVLKALMKKLNKYLTKGAGDNS